MTMLKAAVILLVGFTACSNPTPSDSQTQKEDQTKHAMKNRVSIVEIPTADFLRAVAFYQAILGITIEVVEMEGIKMGLFPNENEGVTVQLISGSDYKPSSDGTVVYLNGGDDLQTIVDKIEANRGKIIIPKTEIGPEMGFYAVFIDTEGNKLGLHSYK